MKQLIDYIFTDEFPDEPLIFEMATISRDVKLGKNRYKIAVHGTLSGDRKNPHIHIYLSTDNRLYNKFNFEISIVDILCYDEINLISTRYVLW